MMTALRRRNLLRPVYGALVLCLAALLFGLELYDFVRAVRPFDGFGTGRRLAAMAADVVVIASGPLAYLLPARSRAIGWLVVLGAVVSLIAGAGGYYFGALLAVVGAALTIRWSPTY